jgi:hypothetical protein
MQDLKPDLRVVNTASAVWRPDPIPFAVTTRYALFMSETGNLSGSVTKELPDFAYVV